MTGKLNPLTEHGRNMLAELAKTPMPTLAIESYLIDRFQRGRLIEIVRRKSPFKIHQGGDCDHAKITDAGLAELGLLPEKTVKPRKKKKSSVDTHRS